MKISQMTNLMQCYKCGYPGLSMGDHDVVCRVCKTTLEVRDLSLVFSDAQHDASPEWQALQDAGMLEYTAGRGLAKADEVSGPAEGSEAVALLFGGFMATTLDRDDLVLDIGSGVHKDLPLYIRDLNLKGYFGLEPIVSSIPSGFPVLQGAIAEKLPIRDGVLDAVIFATSMDHIEDIDTAIAESIRALGINGRIYMWIGIYDPDMVAHMKTFHNVMFSPRMKQSNFKRTIRFLGAPLEYGHTLWKMNRRAINLRNGDRIDQYHCRWYTRDTVKSSLQRWNLKEVRSLIVPGANSMFVEAVAA